MRLRKSTEYSIRCLVYMAQRADDLSSVKHLSKTLKIPYKFLARLMTELSRGGIVQSVRGKNGGYRIAHPLEDITLSDIISVVEGEEDTKRCILGFDECDDEHPCALHEFWRGPRQHVIDMENTVTLAHLAANRGTRL